LKTIAAYRNGSAACSKLRMAETASNFRPGRLSPTQWPRLLELMTFHPSPTFEVDLNGSSVGPGNSCDRGFWDDLIGKLCLSNIKVHTLRVGYFPFTKPPCSSPKQALSQLEEVLSHACFTELETLDVLELADMFDRQSVITEFCELFPEALRRLKLKRMRSLQFIRMQHFPMHHQSRQHIACFWERLDNLRVRLKFLPKGIILYRNNSVQSIQDARSKLETYGPFSSRIEIDGLTPTERTALGLPVHNHIGLLSEELQSKLTLTCDVYDFQCDDV